MPVDIKQFLQTFIEESMELLKESEQILLSLDINAVDDESINHLFRAMHSIKGTSRIFNFTSISQFSNTLESFLGQVRSNMRHLTKEDIDLLLKSVDCIRNVIINIKDKCPINESESNELTSIFNKKITLSSTDEPINKSKEPAKNSEKKQEAGDKKTQETGWIIKLNPTKDVLKSGNELSRLFKRLMDIGKLEILVDTKNLPAFPQFDPTECYLSWNLKLYTAISKEEIEDIISWFSDKENTSITAIYSEKKENHIIDAKNNVTSLHSSPATSIRVDTQKIDALINISGELLITQSKLQQITKKLNINRLIDISEILAILEQHSKELQEKVMRIRMVPIEFLFNRFQRMVHDIAKNIDKKVDFIITGEQTELDKNMIELLTEPLLHLIRNALDHGIELPEVREKTGKPPTGTIHLNAYQKGSNIFLDIIDDGAGLSQEKILAKALSTGILKEKKELSEEEIYNLLFQPGFSTAETVSDISGRGVGLDVVYKNITRLGGKIIITSKMGAGTTFKLCLPLTLAIMECQLTKVNDQVYIIPLMVISEIIQLDVREFNEINEQARLYHFREKYIPILFLQEIFSMPNCTIDIKNKLLIIIDVNNQLIGLVVDELLSQQQVVIKNIEENYEKINGIAGVTILGDGSAALILDTNALLNFALNPQAATMPITSTEKTQNPGLKSTQYDTTEEKGSNGLFQFLNFNIAGHEYGLDILTVKEISLSREVTWLPNAPPYIKGIINMRGTIIPIIDICDRFSLENTQPHSLSRKIIIILNVKSNTRERSIGIPIDQIPNTYTIDSNDIMPFTDHTQLILKNYVRGLVTIDNKMIILLKTKDLISDAI